MTLLFLLSLTNALESITTEKYSNEIAKKKSRDVWCLLLYTPFCKKYKESFTALEEASVITNGSVKYGMVNCQGEPKVCESFKITNYPAIVVRNSSTFSDFQEPLNPVRIAKFTHKYVSSKNVKEVDDFWVDDIHEKPSAVLFTTKNKIPGFWAAMSRLYRPETMRFGICRDKDLMGELGVKTAPSVAFFSKNRTVVHEGPLKFRYIRESLQAFIDGRESRAPVPSDFHVNAEFPEICFDYTISCVLFNDNFVDPKFDNVRQHFKNDPFHFFVGVEQFPFDGIQKGDFVIYNAKKMGIIVEKDVSKLSPLLDRVIDGGAKWTPLKRFEYSSDL